MWGDYAVKRNRKTKSVYRNKGRQKSTKNPSSIYAGQKKVSSRQKPVALFNCFLPKCCSWFDNLHSQNVAAFAKPLFSVDKKTRRLFGDKVQKFVASLCNAVVATQACQVVLSKSILAKEKSLQTAGTDVFFSKNNRYYCQNIQIIV